MRRKSENETLLLFSQEVASDKPQQLWLDINFSTTTLPDNEYDCNPEQAERFKQLFAEVRKEVELAGAIARELFPDLKWEKLYHLPHEQFCATWRAYHIRYPCKDELAAREIARELFPDDEFVLTTDLPYDKYRAVRDEMCERREASQPGYLTEIRARAELEPPRKRGAPRDYIPWSEERKNRNRIRLMIERMRRKWSIPAMFIDAVQSHLLTNPQYFGVCPLPGAIDHCITHRDSEARLKAIAYEQELRMEARGQKPLKMPVELKMPDYQYEYQLPPTDQLDQAGYPRLNEIFRKGYPTDGMLQGEVQLPLERVELYQGEQLSLETGTKEQKSHQSDRLFPSKPVEVNSVAVYREQVYYSEVKQGVWRTATTDDLKALKKGDRVSIAEQNWVYTYLRWDTVEAEVVVQFIGYNFRTRIPVEKLQVEWVKAPVAEREAIAPLEQVDSLSGDARAIGNTPKRAEILHDTLARLEQEKSQIKAEGHLAPEGCWIETGKVKGRDFRQAWWRSTKPMFTPKRSRGNPEAKVKSQYIGEEGAEAHKAAIAARERRERLRSIQRQIELLEKEVAEWDAKS